MLRDRNISISSRVYSIYIYLIEIRLTLIGILYEKCMRDYWKLGNEILYMYNYKNFFSSGLLADLQRVNKII